MHKNYHFSSIALHPNFSLNLPILRKLWTCIFIGKPALLTLVDIMEATEVTTLVVATFLDLIIDLIIAPYRHFTATLEALASTTILVTVLESP